jgi:hypothetical protein
MALEWAISHPDQLVVAAAKGDVSPSEIENYLHALTLEGCMPYAKLFIADSASMLSDDNLKTLGGIIERYALTGRIGPVAIVVTTDEAYRQAVVFASAARAERPLRVFREQREAAVWLAGVREGEPMDDEARSEGDKGSDQHRPS